MKTDLLPRRAERMIGTLVGPDHIVLGPCVVEGEFAQVSGDVEQWEIAKELWVEGIVYEVLRSTILFGYDDYFPALIEMELRVKDVVGEPQPNPYEHEWRVCTKCGYTRREIMFTCVRCGGRTAK